MQTNVEVQSYCVGLDISQDTFDACLLVEYQNRSCKVIATKKFDNTPSGFVLLSEWV